MPQWIVLALRMLAGAAGGCAVGFLAITWFDWPVEARLALVPVASQSQAATWKVFRAVEPVTNGDAVYIFLVDPVVKGADYGVARILAEAFPSEAQALNGRYADTYSSGQSIVDLTLIASLGQGTTQAAAWGWVASSASTSK